MKVSVQHDFQSLLVLFRSTSYRLLIEGIDYDRNDTLPPFIIVPKNSSDSAKTTYQPLVSDFHIDNYQVKYPKTIRDNYYPNSKKIAAKYNIPLQGVSILGIMVQMHVRNTDGLTLDKITLTGTKLGGAILTKERCQDFQDVLTTLNVKYTRLDLGWVCIILLDDTNMAKASNKYQALLNKTTKQSRKIHLDAITLPTKVVHNKSQYIYSLWGAGSNRRNISASNALAFVMYFPTIFVAKLLKYFFYNTYEPNTHEPNIYDSNINNTPHNSRVSLLHTIAHIAGSAIALGGYYYLLIKGTRYLFDLTYTQSITQKYLYTAHQYLSNTNIQQHLNSMNLSTFGEMLNNYIVSVYVFLGSEVSLLHISSNYWNISTLTATLLLVGAIPMLRHVSIVILGFIMIVALTLPGIILLQMALIHSASPTLQGLDATLSVASTNTDIEIEMVLGDLLTLGGSMLIAAIGIPVLYVYLALRFALRLARQYSPPRPSHDMPWLT